MTLFYAWIPNGLSLSRLLLGIAFPWFPPEWRVGVVIAAAFSDMIDGASGRWLGVTSKLGQMLDPVADKGFVAAVVFTLWLEKTIPSVELLAIGSRDIVVTGGLLWLIIAGPRALIPMLRPRWPGKFATAAQFVWLAGVLMKLDYFPTGVFFITALLSGFAAIDYTVSFARIFRNDVKSEG